MQTNKSFTRYLHLVLLKKITSLVLALVMLLSFSISMPTEVSATPTWQGITTPTRGAEIQTNFTVSWQAAPSTNFYLVTIRNLTLDVVEVERHRTTSTSFRHEFTGNSEYRVFVQPVQNPHHYHIEGQSVDFRTRAGTWNSGISPSENFQVTAGQSTTINWRSDSRADTYLVSIRNLDTNELVVNRREVNTTSFTHTFQSAGSRYTVHIQPAIRAGRLGFHYHVPGASRTIRTRELPQQTPEPRPTPSPTPIPNWQGITAPTPGIEIAPQTNFTISWRAAPSTNFYLVTIRNLTLDVVEVERYRTTSTSFRHEFTGNSEYRVFVQPVQNPHHYHIRPVRQLKDMLKCNKVKKNECI